MTVRNKFLRIFFLLFLLFHKGPSNTSTFSKYFNDQSLRKYVKIKVFQLVTNNIEFLL